VFFDAGARIRSLRGDSAQPISVGSLLYFTLTCRFADPYAFDLPLALIPALMSQVVLDTVLTRQLRVFSFRFVCESCRMRKLI
jgi:hypothetical protein